MSDKEKGKIYGLHSFYNPQEAWDIITADWGYESGIQILDDAKFEKAVIEQAIIGIVAAKNGITTLNVLKELLGIGSTITDFLCSFNFFLYSQKTGKFYTSILSGDGDYYNDAYSEEERRVFMELYTVHRFDILVSKAVDYVKSQSSLFDECKKEEVLEKLLEAYWNEPDL